MFLADLHIHSRYSRATSRDCVPEHLEAWARRKGLDVIGTGDFTHPAWRDELREKLEPAEDGLYTKLNKTGTCALHLQYKFFCFIQSRISCCQKSDKRFLMIKCIFYFF